MLDILMAGGWPLAPIFVASALMLAIVFERFWSLRRKAVLPEGLRAEVTTLVRTRKVEAQHLEALAENSPLGEVLAAAVAVRSRSRDVIKERIEDTGRHVVHRMERYLSSLGTIALVSPLLGLLGTVIGLIHMFLAVMVSGVGDPMKMAGGIGEALICTAAGLVVAIPAYILHRYFRNRVSGYLVDMEREAGALLDDLTVASSPAAPRAALKPAPKPASATATSASRTPSRASR